MKVIYREKWDDEYAAKGWKLEEAMGDAEIIAVTPWHPENIATSVFVHDVLDHYISGFDLSGHRAEAGALFQLGLRTGTDIDPDIEEMIELDILQGRVYGESLDSFLPDELDYYRELSDPHERMLGIRKLFGDNYVKMMLKVHYYNIGKAGHEKAQLNWKKAGLDYKKRKETGEMLQQLFERMDEFVSKEKEAEAEITVMNELCYAVFQDKSVITVGC